MTDFFFFLKGSNFTMASESQNGQETINSCSLVISLNKVYFLLQFQHLKAKRFFMTFYPNLNIALNIPMKNNKLDATINRRLYKADCSK